MPHLRSPDKACQVDATIWPHNRQREYPAPRGDQDHQAAWRKRRDGSGGPPLNQLVHNGRKLGELYLIGPAVLRGAGNWYAQTVENGNPQAAQALSGMQVSRELMSRGVGWW